MQTTLSTIAGQVAQNENDENLISRNDNVGECVWYGICDIKNGKKVKNCYDLQPARALNISGIEALKQHCNHLIHENYIVGDDVYTCCDNAQVKSIFNSIFVI